MKGLGCKPTSTASLVKQLTHLSSGQVKMQTRDRKRKERLLKRQVQACKRRSTFDTESNFGLSPGKFVELPSREGSQDGGDDSSSNSSGAEGHARKRLAS